MHFAPSRQYRQRPNGGEQQQSHYVDTLLNIDTKLDRMNETIHRIDKDVTAIKTDVSHIRKSFATKEYVLQAKNEVVGEIGCTNVKVAGLDSSFRLTRWIVGTAIVFLIGVATVIAIIVAPLLN